MGNWLCCGGHKHQGAARLRQPLSSSSSLLPSSIVKMVHESGTVEELEAPLTVSQYLGSAHHSQHCICATRDLATILLPGSSRPLWRLILPEDADLDPSLTYFLLRLTTLESPLTQSDVASLLAKARLAQTDKYAKSPTTSCSSTTTNVNPKGNKPLQHVPLLSNYNTPECRHPWRPMLGTILES